MKRFVHEASPMDILNEYQDRADVMSEDEIETATNICGNLDPDSDSQQFEFMDRKDVLDSDGFYTEYTLYYDVLNDRYVTVFGDSDIYRPEDGDFDMEFESEAEALEWFDDYKGFADDKDEVDW